MVSTTTPRKPKAGSPSKAFHPIGDRGEPQVSCELSRVWLRRCRASSPPLIQRPVQPASLCFTLNLCDSSCGQPDFRTVSGTGHPQQRPRGHPVMGTVCMEHFRGSWLRAEGGSQLPHQRTKGAKLKLTQGTAPSETKNKKTFQCS